MEDVVTRRLPAGDACGLAHSDGGECEPEGDRPLSDEELEALAMAADPGPLGLA